MIQTSRPRCTLLGVLGSAHEKFDVWTGPERTFGKRTRATEKFISQERGVKLRKYTWAAALGDVRFYLCIIFSDRMVNFIDLTTRSIVPVQKFDW